MRKRRTKIRQIWIKKVSDKRSNGSVEIVPREMNAVYMTSERRIMRMRSAIMVPMYASSAAGRRFMDSA